AGGYMGLIAVAFVIMPSAFRSSEDWDTFERWSLHALAVVSVVSVLLGVRHLPDAIVPSAGGLRLRWAFTHVNTGGYIGYLGAFWAFRQVVLRRWRFVVPLLFFLFLMVSAGSRGAYVSLFVALITVGILELARRKGIGN